MPEDLAALTTRLEEVATRLGRIENRLADGDPSNGPAEPESRWQYLISRPHRWRKQLSIKGRNTTVGQLVSAMRASAMTPEQASERFELPLGAIYEALTYYAEQRGLIEMEASEERRRLAERGLPLGPTNLPR